MDYTLGSLKDILRRRLQDEEFDGTTLTHFVNDAINEILGEDKYPFMQRIDKYTADNEGEISLPPQFAGTYYIYAKRCKEPRQELRYIEPEEYFAKNKALTFVYTVFANTLFYRLNKNPNDNTYEIMHLYLINPKPLVNDTDKLPIPSQYSEAVVLGAMARVEEIRDNYDYAQIFRNQQEALVTNMKLRYGPGNLTAKNRAVLPYYGGFRDGIQ